MSDTKLQVRMRVIGHELVTVKDQDVADEYDMLKIKLRGRGDDKKTVATILVDPEHAATYPLGEHGELIFEIRQQRLALEGSEAKH